MKNDIHTVTKFHPVDYLASRVMRYDQMMGSKPSTISVLGRKCVFQYNSLKIAWDIEYRIVYERIDYCGHLRIGWGKIAHFDRENRLKGYIGGVSWITFHMIFQCVFHYYSFKIARDRK